MTRKCQADKNQAPGLQIPREELLRLVDQTGILEKVPASDHEPTASSIPPRASQENGDDEEEYPLAEEIFAATTLLIPMSFLLLMMYM